VNVGFTGSASVITGDRLSGINTRNTPLICGSRCQGLPADS
jgi:hypothetical protein